MGAHSKPLLLRVSKVILERGGTGARRQLSSPPSTTEEEKGRYLRNRQNDTAECADYECDGMMKRGGGYCVMRRRLYLQRKHE